MVPGKEAIKVVIPDNVLCINIVRLNVLHIVLGLLLVAARNDHLNAFRRAQGRWRKGRGVDQDLLVEAVRQSQYRVPMLWSQVVLEG